MEETSVEAYVAKALTAEVLRGTKEKVEAVREGVQPGVARRAWAALKAAMQEAEAPGEVLRETRMRVEALWVAARKPEQAQQAAAPSVGGSWEQAHAAAALPVAA